ncbi:hypothetical protein D3C87_1625420 [compost metagenome]
MISNLFAFKTFTAFSLKFTFINQLLYQLSVVYDFISTSQSWVLIFYGIETVRASCNDFLDVITIEYFNVGHGLHLEQELITSTFCRISSAAFFGTQNCIFHTYMV